MPHMSQQATTPRARQTFGQKARRLASALTLVGAIGGGTVACDFSSSSGTHVPTSTVAVTATPGQSPEEIAAEQTALNGWIDGTTKFESFYKYKDGSAPKVGGIIQMYVHVPQPHASDKPFKTTDDSKADEIALNPAVIYVDNTHVDIGFVSDTGQRDYGVIPLENFVDHSWLISNGFIDTSLVEGSYFFGAENSPQNPSLVEIQAGLQGTQKIHSTILMDFFINRFAHNNNGQDQLKNILGFVRSGKANPYVSDSSMTPPALPLDFGNSFGGNDLGHATIPNFNP